MSTPTFALHVHPDRTEMGVSAARSAAATLRAATAERGAARMIAAAAPSQLDVYRALAQEPGIDWSKVTGFHLDEYVGLPITHPASFRLYLWQRFVSRLPLPLAAFHFVNAEKDPANECKRLGQIIRTHPVDVCFMGIGENGHLAFNDPPADFQTEVPYLVVELDEACRRQQLGEGWFESLDAVPERAISMSVRQIMKSAAIVCTVPDARKATAVGRALSGPITPDLPASVLQRHPECRLYLDVYSAGELPT